MKIVFMGSTEFSCASLNSLISCSNCDVVAVVTQPDRPKGRKLRITTGVVAAVAQENNIPVLVPANVNSEESLNDLREFNPDVIAVVAYGQILKKELLDVPSLACVNIHASLLPKYRGAAPIQLAVTNGDEKTGVTAMYMSEGMDEGDIISQSEIIISESDTGGTVHDKLAEAGGKLLVQTVEQFAAGTVSREKQNDDEASYAPKISKEDGKIDWTRTGIEIYNRVRGFNPWPVCWCEFNGHEKLRVLAVRREQGKGRPGEVIDLSGDGPLIAVADGAVRLLELQPAGKKVMTGDAFLRGHSHGLIIE